MIADSDSVSNGWSLPGVRLVRTTLAPGDCVVMATDGVDTAFVRDVAGGIVIGVLVALAGWPLAVRVLEPLAARLARSPLRPLVFARDTQ